MKYLISDKWKNDSINNPLPAWEVMSQAEFIENIDCAIDAYGDPNLPYGFHKILQNTVPEMPEGYTLLSIMSTCDLYGGINYLAGVYHTDSLLYEGLGRTIRDSVLEGISKVRQALELEANNVKN